MPLVPPTSSSLFRPISDDKPWHRLLTSSPNPQTSSTVTPPESSRSQQSPPPSPPRTSIASSTSSSSISLSIQPPPPLSPQYHTSVSSANNQSTYSAPSVSKDNDTDPPQNHTPQSPPQHHTSPQVVRFTAEQVTVPYASPSESASPQPLNTRNFAPRGARDARDERDERDAPREIAFAPEDEPAPGRLRSELVRIRPTSHTATAAHDTSNASLGLPSREDGIVVRDQHDLLADLQDLSNMLTDHIDVTKGFMGPNGDRGRRPGSRFIKRIFTKMRSVRNKDRERLAAENSAIAAAAAAAVKRDIHYSSGFRDTSDELRQLVRVEDDVYGDYGDDLEEECWSESELQTLSGGKRQYVGFTKRNDTDIEAFHADKGTVIRGHSRGVRGGGEAAWRPRGGRRRSMDNGTRREEPGRLTRMSRSTVAVGKDWEDLSKGRSRMRLRMKGSHMDRRADRSEVEGRSGDVWGRWKEDVGWGRDQSVASLPAEHFSRELLTRGEHSFRSADSSGGALSVSSLTQASRTSSMN